MPRTTNEAAPIRASSRRDIAAVRLARGESIAQIAKETGIGKRSIFRWKRDPGFTSRVAEMRREMVAAGIGALVDCLNEAVTTVRALLASENETVRLSAAKTVLHLLKSHENEGFEAKPEPLVKVFVGIDMDEI